MDAQIELVVSTDALPVSVVNTPVDRACTDELVEFLKSIEQEWLTGPFMVNRVLDLETIRTLKTKDLMDMDIPQNPCDFLFQALAERDKARALQRVWCWHHHQVKSGHACLSCTFRACAFAGRRCRRFIGHCH